MSLNKKERSFSSPRSGRKSSEATERKNVTDPNLEWERGGKECPLGGYGEFSFLTWKGGKKGSYCGEEEGDSKPPSQGKRKM